MWGRAPRSRVSQLFGHDRGRLALSRQYCVNEMPTFVAGQRGGMAAQPYELLERLVQDDGTKRKD